MHLVQYPEPSLKSNISGGGGDRQEKVDMFLMGYRSTPSTVTGMSPAKLLFGREMNTRLDCLKPKLSISCMQEPNLSKDVRSLEVGDIAKVRNNADKRKWISGVIFREIGSKIYEVKIGNKLVIRHVDQLLKTRCKIPENNDDWYDTMNTDKSCDQPIIRRYPERIRKPVDRYGV